MEQSHLISERIFGSSKRIQFIGTSSIDSFLNAIDFEKCDHLPAVEPCPHPCLQPPSPHQQMRSRAKTERPTTRAPREAMSIETLLMDSQPAVVEAEKRKRRLDTTTIDSISSSLPGSTQSIVMADLENEDNKDTEEYRAAKIRRHNNNISHHETSGTRAQQCMTTVTCYHASVAQKSYGSEKRFLCPPPLVSIHSSGSNIPSSTKTTQPVVSMAVMCEGSDRYLEQKVQLGDTQQGSFKYLHVTGTAKAKQFYLRVSLQNATTTHRQQQSLGQPIVSALTDKYHTTMNGSSVTGSLPPSSALNPPPLAIGQSYLTFFSNPISIISKPSKKTSKLRNMSTCILANSTVSLYNRINSQTVRTKYMSTEHGNLCAKIASWSPFKIVVLRQPSEDEDSPSSTEVMNTRVTTAYASTVNYGSEILLRDTQTGVESLPMIIRKVEKGKILRSATGPLSQMHKVALQLATTAGSSSSSDDDNDNDNDQRMYLLPTGQSVSPPGSQEDSNNGAATWLDFVASQTVVDKSDEARVEQVDDYLCWTIVGIAKFEYQYHEPPLPPAMPLTMSASAASASVDAVVATAMPTSPPPSPPRRIVPLPLITHVAYHPRQNTLIVTGQHLVQSTTGCPFEIRLGQHQEDALMALDQQVLVDEDNTKKAPLLRLVLDLPPTQDLLIAHHNVLIARPDGSRYFELPLVLAHHDGSSFTFGKALACDILPNGDARPWFIVNTAPAASPSSS